MKGIAQVQAVLSFQKTGQERSGSSVVTGMGKGTQQQDNIHEQQKTKDKEDLARWISRDEKQQAWSSTVQEQVSAYPRKKEDPGNRRQMQCPVRNSKTEPLGQKTQRNVLQGQRATETDPTLKISLWLWMEDCIYGLRLLLQQNNYSPRKAAVGERWRKFYWIFKSSTRLSVDCGERRNKIIFKDQLRADIGTQFILKVNFFKEER